MQNIVVPVTGLEKNMARFTYLTVKISSPTGEVILNFVAEDVGIVSLIVLHVMYFHRWMVPDSQETRLAILIGGQGTHRTTIFG